MVLPNILAQKHPAKRRRSLRRISSHCEISQKHNYGVYIRTYVALKMSTGTLKPEHVADMSSMHHIFAV